MKASKLNYFTKTFKVKSYINKSIECEGKPEKSQENTSRSCKDFTLDPTAEV